MSNHSNPYSVQFNSDPRSRHGNCSPFRFINTTNNPSHPYIIAQRNKKISNNNNFNFNNNNNNNRTGGGYQAIPIRSNSNSISPLNSNNNNFVQNRNRKRKYIDTIENDQEQFEYNEYLKIGSKKKKHITQQTVMHSITMLQKTELNTNIKSDIQFKKPSNKSWQNCVQFYFNNEKLCNVLNFTKMEQNNNNNNNMNQMEIKEDFEMGENVNVNKKIKKKRPIRLHHSYTGFTKDGFLNSEELKKIANKCYVSTVKNNKNCMENDKNNNANNMDCD